MNPQTFHEIGYGMYIASTRYNDQINGLIVNTVFQITAEPALFGISINKEHLTHELLMQSKVVAISILDQSAPLPFLGTFGFRTGRNFNKFEKVPYTNGKNTCPIVSDHCLGYMEATIVDTYDAGTHTLFLAEVTEAEITADGIPLTYEHYREEKGGKSPPGAPTYLQPVQSI